MMRSRNIPTPSAGEVPRSTALPSVADLVAGRDAIRQAQQSADLEQCLPPMGLSDMGQTPRAVCEELAKIAREQRKSITDLDDQQIHDWHRSRAGA